MNLRAALFIFVAAWNVVGFALYLWKVPTLIGRVERHVRQSLQARHGVEIKNRYRSLEVVGASSPLVALLVQGQYFASVALAAVAPLALIAGVTGLLMQWV